MKTIKDFLGNAIEVGAEIVYAASVGRSPVLVHAEVIETRPENYVDPETQGYCFRKASIVVKPLKRLYGDWMQKDKIPLQFPERCLVVRK